MLNSPPLSITNGSTLISNEFKLYQNYPNPFNPNTLIQYSISKPSNVAIKIYDMHGKEIKTLVNKYHGRDNYKINFNSEGYSSGTYFYQLIINGLLIESKKMILIK
jgi:hypothetical protein